MTKKQVVCSLRERVDHVRDIYDRELSRSVDCDDISYYTGCIDCLDSVLEMLCDYDLVKAVGVNFIFMSWRFLILVIIALGLMLGFMPILGGLFLSFV